eukprot:4679270-Pyramimonas_sp.AAC.1
MTGQGEDSGGVRGAYVFQAHQLERSWHCEARRRVLCCDAARAARLRRGHLPGGPLLGQDHEAGGRRGRPLPGHTAGRWGKSRYGCRCAFGLDFFYEEM